MQCVNIFVCKCRDPEAFTSVVSTLWLATNNPIIRFMNEFGKNDRTLNKPGIRNHLLLRMRGLNLFIGYEDRQKSFFSSPRPLQPLQLLFCPATDVRHLFRSSIHQ